MGATCPALTSIASDETGSTVMLVARGSDDALWYRRIRHGGWDDEWQSMGGKYTSQPVAVSPGKGSIMVMAVSEDQTPVSRTFEDGKGWSDETRMAESLSCTSYVSAATWNTGTVKAYCAADILFSIPYSAGSWGVLQQYGYIYVDEPPSLVSPDRGYLSLAVLGGNAAIKPRPPLYNVSNQHWNPKHPDGTGWENAWGPVRGRPETVATSTTRVEYFAAGADGKSLWSNVWTLGRDGSADEEEEREKYVVHADYSTPESVTGDVQSAPVGVYIPSLHRVDLFFVATNGSLMHGTKIDGSWIPFAGHDTTDPWEDLGGHFNSAPSIWVNGSNIVAFGLGPQGSLIHSTFAVEDDHPLGPGKWHDDGGKLNSNWLVNGTQTKGGS